MKNKKLADCKIKPIRRAVMKIFLENVRPRKGIILNSWGLASAMMRVGTKESVMIK